MNYKLHPALWSEMESGAVWLGQPALASRTVVRIARREPRRAIYCEAKIIDAYFLEVYQKSVGEELQNPSSCVLMSAWYRKLIGLSLDEEIVDLEVVAVDSLYGRVRACLNHPQLAIRLATILALWSLFLSFVGFLLGLLSLA